MNSVMNSPKCRAFVIALATSFMLIVSVAGGRGAQAADANVTMGTSGPFTTIVYLPTLLADRLGFFKEEGVNIKLQQFNGGSQAAAALVSGGVDVLTGNYNHTIQLAVQGKRVVAFAQMTQTPGLLLVVSPKSRKPIKSFEDLRGANVGVSAPGGGSDILLKYLLARAGIPAAQVPVVSIGLDHTAVAAMEYGKVDAAVMLDPAFSALKSRVRPAVLEVLVDLREPDQVQKYFDAPAVPTASFYSTPEWLAANPETARKLTRALAKSMAWIRSHTAEEVMAQLPASYGEGQPDVYIEAVRQNKRGVATSLRIDPAGAQSILKMMAPTSPVDITKTYSNDYLP